RQITKAIKANLERGLNFTQSLVSAGVEQFRSYISSIASLLVAGALGRGSRLVGEAAFKTYMVRSSDQYGWHGLATCCADRVDTFRKWIGVATLRALNVSVVPDELQVEPLNGLMIRVLYRLRSLSEQITFDSPTFSYAYPLLSEALRRGGISAADEDEALEQVTL
ncbi:hypothetical protein M378DRAFT_34132, partial [Amanita muscaria Koide BX008]